jgi:hypothetical protein
LAWALTSVADISIPDAVKSVILSFIYWC